MSSPFIGEIRLFGGNFAPQGWAFCDGSLVAIADNDALFALIGTTYGGDGQTTFALPDLRGRVPLHQGTGAGRTVTIGEQAGVEAVTLTQQQLPAHTHQPAASNGQATQTTPAGGVWAVSSAGTAYAPGVATVPMQAGLIDAAGGSQPHDNMAPTLVTSYIISLFGIFPTQA
jgi:microcystin-dependent protein